MNCTVDSGVSASQKYAPEIHSVMMTGALREKFPNLVRGVVADSKHKTEGASPA